MARQSLRDFECLVVDDGSSDATREIAAACALRDARFRLLALPHRGLVAALNAGLAACRAPLVARMDADDLMHQQRLRLQCAALEADPALAALGCHVRIFPRAGLGRGMRAYERWLRSIDSPQRVREEAFVECPLAHPTLLARRAVLEGEGGWRERGWPEDYDLVLRLLAAGHGVGVLPRRLLAWRDTPGRLSRSSASYTQERFTACKAEFLARGPLARDERYVLWGYGATGRALRRALAAYGRTPCHVVELHPGRLGQRIHGAPVVAPEALPGLPRRPIVVSVAGAGPRGEIRARLAGLGFRELRDFVCAA